MTEGRYELSWTDRVGVEVAAMRHEGAELLLTLRDHRRQEADPSSIAWRVLDSRTEAEVEWCPRCRSAAVVGAKLCGDCELELEIAKGEPWGVAVEWNWPASPAAIGDVERAPRPEHLHLI